MPVWTALSELFLDVEPGEDSLRFIEERLRRSPCRVTEIGCILRNEVMPAFIPNMLATAGRWTPWTEEEVHEIMARSLARNCISRLRAKLLASWHWRMIEPDWRGIAARMQPIADATPRRE